MDAQINNQEQMQVQKQKKKFYKKWWFWVIVVVVGIAIFSSTSEDESSGTPTNTPPAVTTTASENSAVTKAPQVSEEDYKDSCETYTYNELARTPDTYKNKKIQLTGEVIQVLEEGKRIDIRINMNGVYDHTIYITYTLKDGECRILDGDIITVYGTFEGLVTYESVMGASVTIPRVDAKYIEMDY